MSHTQNKSSIPFDLDPMEFPFRDTIIVQAVPLPTMLRWGHEGSGFFVETDIKPILSGKKWKVITESPVSEFDQALIAVRVL